MLRPAEEGEETKTEVMAEVSQTNGCWSASGAGAVVAGAVDVLENLSAEEEEARSRSHRPACGHGEFSGL